MTLYRLGLFVAMLAVTVPAVAATGSGALSLELIAGFEKKLAEDPGVKSLVNAATNNDLRDLSLNRELVAAFDGRFNFELKGTKIIDQKSSGRCWMFAGCNVITPRVMTSLKLSDFGLSQAYIAFWDRLEKSNFFLETMIAMRGRAIDDRALQMNLENPIGDGGWWTYFSSLIRPRPGNRRPPIAPTGC
jgi:bleomycin hydrolase